MTGSASPESGRGRERGRDREPGTGHFDVLDAVIEEAESIGFDVRRVETHVSFGPDAIAARAGDAERPGIGLGLDGVERDIEVTVAAGAPLAPIDVLRTLGSAIDAGRHCTFAVPMDGRGSGTRRAERLATILRTRGRVSGDETPVDMSADGANERERERERVVRYWSTERVLSIDGVECLRPAGTSGEWFGRGDRIVHSSVERPITENSTETVHVSFPSHEAFIERSPETRTATLERESEGAEGAEAGYTVTEADGTTHRYASRETVGIDWETVRVPFVPAVEYDRPPTPDDWSIIGVNAAASDGDDGDATGEMEGTDGSRLHRFE